MGNTASLPTKPIEIARINRNVPEIYRENNLFDHLHINNVTENKIDKTNLLEFHLEKFNNNFMYFVLKHSIKDLDFTKVEKLRELTDKDYKVSKILHNHEDTKEVVVAPENSEKHIYMCRHFVTSLNENIGFLQQTQVLQVCCNYLTKIPRSIKHLKGLKMLILTKNRIKELPEELGCCTELRELDLSHNLIEKIPNSIASLKTLNVLHLSHNKLKTLNNAIGKLSSLKSLFLERNQLTHLPLEVLKLPFLTQLITEGNILKENLISSIKQIGDYTLYEECSRQIIRNNMHIPCNLTKKNKDFLISVKECSFCGGPYFSNYFEVEAMHEFDGLMYPVKYSLCSKHYETHEKRIQALFASDHKITKPIKLLEAKLPSVTEIFEPFCHSEDLIDRVKGSFEVENSEMPLICLSLYNSNFFRSYMQSKRRELPDDKEEVKKKNIIKTEQ